MSESENVQNESAEHGVDQDVKRQLDQLDGLLLDFKPEPESGETEQIAAGDSGAAMETEEMVTAVLTIIFSMMATRRGDHWALSDAESEMLGGALAAVLDKYMPDMKGGPEATLIVVVLLIVGPRAAVDRNIKSQKAQLRAVDTEKGGNANADAEAASKSGADASDLWVKEAA